MEEDEMFGFSLNDTSPCKGCQELQKVIEKQKEDKQLNYKTLKQKIMSTDQLIKRFNSKREDYDQQSKMLEDVTRKLERSKRDTEMLEGQLQSSLQQIEPLKSDMSVLKTTLNIKDAEIQILNDKLKAADMLRAQFEAVGQQHETERILIDKAEKGRKSLHKRIESLESSKEKLEKEVSRLKEGNKILKNENKRLQKDVEKSLKAKQTFLYGLGSSPQTAKRRKKEKGYNSNNESLLAKDKVPFSGGSSTENELCETVGVMDICSSDEDVNFDLDFAMSPLGNLLSPLPPTPVNFTNDEEQEEWTNDLDHISDSDQDVINEDSGPLDEDAAAIEKLITDSLEPDRLEDNTYDNSTPTDLTQEDSPQEDIIQSSQPNSSNKDKYHNNLTSTELTQPCQKGSALEDKTQEHHSSLAGNETNNITNNNNVAATNPPSNKMLQNVKPLSEQGSTKKTSHSERITKPLSEQTPQLCTTDNMKSTQEITNSPSTSQKSSSNTSTIVNTTNVDQKNTGDAISTNVDLQDTKPVFAINNCTDGDTKDIIDSSNITKPLTNSIDSANIPKPLKDNNKSNTLDTGVVTSNSSSTINLSKSVYNNIHTTTDQANPPFECNNSSIGQTESVIGNINSNISQLKPVLVNKDSIICDSKSIIENSRSTLLDPEALLENASTSTNGFNSITEEVKSVKNSTESDDDIKPVTGYYPTSGTKTVTVVSSADIQVFKSGYSADNSTIADIKAITVSGANTITVVCRANTVVPDSITKETKSVTGNSPLSDAGTGTFEINTQMKNPKVVTKDIHFIENAKLVSENSLVSSAKTVIPNTHMEDSKMDCSPIKETKPVPESITVSGTRSVTDIPTAHNKVLQSITKEMQFVAGKGPVSSTETVTVVPSTSMEASISIKQDCSSITETQPDIVKSTVDCTKTATNDTSTHTEVIKDTKSVIENIICAILPACDTNSTIDNISSHHTSTTHERRSVVKNMNLKIEPTIPDNSFIIEEAQPIIEHIISTIEQTIPVIADTQTIHENDNTIIDNTTSIIQKLEPVDVVTTDDSKPVIVSNSAISDDSKPVIVSNSTSTDDSKPVIVSNSAITDDSKPVIVSNSATTDNSKPVIVSNSAITDDSKPVIVSNNSIMDDSKPVIVSDSAITDDSGSITVNNNSIMDDSKPEHIVSNSTSTDDIKPVIVNNSATTDDSRPVTVSNSAITDDSKPAIVSNNSIMDDNKPVVLNNNAITDDSNHILDNNCVRIVENKHVIEHNYSTLKNKHLLPDIKSVFKNDNLTLPRMETKNSTLAKISPILETNNSERNHSVDNNNSTIVETSPIMENNDSAICTNILEIRVSSPKVSGSSDKTKIDNTKVTSTLGEVIQTYDEDKNAINYLKDTEAINLVKDTSFSNADTNFINSLKVTKTTDEDVKPSIQERKLSHSTFEDGTSSPEDALPVIYNNNLRETCPIILDEKNKSLVSSDAKTETTNKEQYVKEKQKKPVEDEDNDATFQTTNVRTFNRIAHVRNGCKVNHKETIENNANLHDVKYNGGTSGSDDLHQPKIGGRKPRKAKKRKRKEEVEEIKLIKSPKSIGINCNNNNISSKLPNTHQDAITTKNTSSNKGDAKDITCKFVTLGSGGPTLKDMNFKSTKQNTLRKCEDENCKKNMKPIIVSQKSTGFLISGIDMMTDTLKSHSSTLPSKENRQIPSSSCFTSKGTANVQKLTSESIPIKAASRNIVASTSNIVDIFDDLSFPASPFEMLEMLNPISPLPPSPDVTNSQLMDDVCLSSFDNDDDVREDAEEMPKDLQDGILVSFQSRNTNVNLPKPFAIHPILNPNPHNLKLNHTKSSQSTKTEVDRMATRKSIAAIKDDLGTKHIQDTEVSNIIPVTPRRKSHELPLSSEKYTENHQIKTKVANSKMSPEESKEMTPKKETRLTNQKNEKARSSTPLLLRSSKISTKESDSDIIHENEPEVSKQLQNQDILPINMLTSASVHKAASESSKQPHNQSIIESNAEILHNAASTKQPQNQKAILTTIVANSALLNKNGSGISNQIQNKGISPTDQSNSVILQKDASAKEHMDLENNIPTDESISTSVHKAEPVSTKQAQHKQVILLTNTEVKEISQKNVLKRKSTEDPDENQSKKVKTQLPPTGDHPLATSSESGSHGDSNNMQTDLTKVMETGLIAIKTFLDKYYSNVETLSVSWRQLVLLIHQTLKDVTQEFSYENIPVKTGNSVKMLECEQNICLLVQNIVTKFPACGLDLLLDILWTSATSKDLELVSILSITRVYTAMCRMKGDLELARVFVYHTLGMSTNKNRLVSQMLAVFSVWSLVVDRNFPKANIMVPVIQHIVLKSQISLDNQGKKALMKLCTICNWPTDLSVNNNTTLLDKIIKYLKEHNNNKTRLYEGTSSLRLLLLQENWTFIQRYFVNKQVSSVCQKWSLKGGQDVDHVYVESILSVLGEVVVPAMNPDMQNIKSLLQSYLAPTLNTPTTITSVTDCAADVIMKLSPFAPDDSMVTLLRWFKKHKAVLPAPLKSRLRQTRHLLMENIPSFNCAEFV